MITPALLARFGVIESAAWAAALASACGSRAINTPLRVAAFLSETLYESSKLSQVVENLNYSAAGLLATFPTHFDFAAANQLGRTAAHPADQRGIAERAYGGRMGNGPSGCGDGFLYRGRCPIQVTGKNAYAALAEHMGVELADLPALLETKQGAAAGAAEWWVRAGLNELADAGDTVSIRRRVNGSLNALSAVQQLYQIVLRALGDNPVAPSAAAAPAALSQTETLNQAELDRIHSQT